MTDVSLCFSAHTGVILTEDMIQANKCLVLTEIKGCQVRGWIV